MRLLKVKRLLKLGYLLIELIGKEMAIALIYEWAKRNVAVASALIEYIKLLSNDGLRSVSE